MKYKKFDYLFFIIVVLLLMLLGASVRAQTGADSELRSSGGTFVLTKSVIAGGGKEKHLAPFNENGTSGQAAAGIRSSGGNFSLYSGFWTPESFAPTAATAVAGGRILTADGRGIRGVIVTILFPGGEMQRAISSNYGYYRFAEIPAGETYVFTVSAKRHTFSQPSQARQIQEDTQDIDFTADAPEPLSNSPLR